MLEVFIHTLGQMTIAFMIVFGLGFSIFYVREMLGLNKSPVEMMYEFDKAELRSGGWQYYDVFFDKMEEFRNDFA